MYLSVFFLTIPLAVSIYPLPCFSVSSLSLVVNLLFLLLSICLSSLAKSFPPIFSFFSIRPASLFFPDLVSLSWISFPHFISLSLLCLEISSRDLFSLLKQHLLSINFSRNSSSSPLSNSHLFHSLDLSLLSRAFISLFQSLPISSSSHFSLLHSAARPYPASHLLHPPDNPSLSPSCSSSFSSFPFSFSLPFRRPLFSLSSRISLSNFALPPSHMSSLSPSHLPAPPHLFDLSP